jgi:glycerate 2-kinase
LWPASRPKQSAVAIDPAAKVTSVPSAFWSQLRSDLLRISAAGITAALPQRLVGRALEGAVDSRIPAMVADAERIRLLAVGKAALGMTSEVQARLGARIHDRLIVTPSPRPTVVADDPTVVVAAHPLPDATSVEAGRAALAFVAHAAPGDLVILLLSGGASSLLAMPAAGITLADKVALSAALMRAGASISELNTVRKHLSMVKGGGLLRALAPDATMLGLVLSDVPGNDLATIGSGPMVADPTTCADAVAVLKRRKLWGRTPEAVRDRFERGAAGELEETLKRDDPALRRSLSIVIGDNQTACDGALAAAQAAGYVAEQWRDLSGPAERICASLADRLKERARDKVVGQGICLVAGGEPQVTVSGSGLGGRAQHCALLLAAALADNARGGAVAALFAGTDGIDGPTDAAGAIVTSTTVPRALEAKLDPHDALRRCDSYNFFRGLGDLLITGPTGTNVTDLFVALVANRKPGPAVVIESPGRSESKVED